MVGEGKTCSVHFNKQELEDFEVLCSLHNLGSSQMLRKLVDDAVADMGTLVAKALKDIDTEAQRKKAKLEKLRERLASGSK